MIGFFLADSDLNSLFALPRDQLQKVAQLRIALSPFRSAGCKDFACGFLAFEFPDSHCGFELPFPFAEITTYRNPGGRFGSMSPARHARSMINDLAVSDNCANDMTIIAARRALGRAGLEIIWNIARWYNHGSAHDVFSNSHVGP